MITIVVLLILAGVTIATLTGDNGILTRAQDAKNKTEEAALEEKIKLLVAETMTNHYTGESEEKTAQELQDELNEQGENVLVVQWDKYIIFDLDENKEYRVMNDGTTKYWGENDIGDKLNNFSNINHSYIGVDNKQNDTIGIDLEGNQVNMNLWECTLLDNNTYILLSEASLKAKNDKLWTNVVTGYKGDFDSVGKIEGNLPSYISIDNGLTYTTVTSISEIFRNCSDLKVSPELPNTVVDISDAFNSTGIIEAPMIPSGVTNMGSTFQNCTLMEKASKIPIGVINLQGTFMNTKITQTPEIPYGVENMYGTFQSTLITEGPVIPNSVIDMRATFKDCDRLVTGSDIPESVTNIESVYSNCTNLGGKITLNCNNLRGYESCFYNVAMEDDKSLVLKCNEYVYNLFFDESRTNKISSKVCQSVANIVLEK